MRRITLSTRALIRIFGKAVKAWWNDNVLRLGASVAYYTLFAIAPILLVVIAVAGSVFGAEAVRGEIVGQIDGLVGVDGGRAVQALLQGAARRDDNALVATIGGITFVLAACGAFLELQSAMNTIWKVEPSPDGHLQAFLLDRLRSFGLVVALGFLLMVSLAASAALEALSAWLSYWAPAMPVVLNTLNVVVSLAGTTALFGLLFKFLPDVELKWRDVATGALVTALHVRRRQADHRALPGPERHCLQLRRRRVGRRPPALGLLHLADCARRRRVHAPLCRPHTRTCTRIGIRSKDELGSVDGVAAWHLWVARSPTTSANAGTTPCSSADRPLARKA